ncbi:MAG: hypothetical protein ACI8ZB_004641 [Desulforhopalus sp.]|jgi:hypothetical protein
MFFSQQGAQIAIIGVTSFTQTFSAFKAGFVPGSLQGNALQLIGAIVVTPEENITYFS